MTAFFNHILTVLSELVVILPLLLASVIAHEYAHGWVAYKLGDDTAKNMGRLSLNPLHHIDPMGTLMLIITYFFGFMFGWAKPVPVNFFALRNYPFSMTLVALAGPATNLLILLFGLVLHKVGFLLHFPDPVIHGIEYLILLNLILILFNLLPIPPLDGSKVVYSFLSRRHVYFMMRYEIYGIPVLLALVLIFQAYIIKFVESILQWLLRFI